MNSEERVDRELGRRWEEGDLDDWWVGRVSRAKQAELHRLGFALGKQAQHRGRQQARILADRWSERAAQDEQTAGALALSFGAVVLAGVLMLEEESADRWSSMVRRACRGRHALMREGAALAVRVAGGLDFDRTLAEVVGWLELDSCFEWRAVLSGLYVPVVVQSLSVSQLREAWKLLDRCVESYEAEQERSSPSCRSLGRVLGEAPSHLVIVEPDEGFEWLERWAESGGAPTRRIVAANLRKARLRKAFPEQVQRVGERLLAEP